VTLKPGFGSLKVIENDTIQPGTHDFLLTFHSNHRPISHCFRGKRRFTSKITNFSHPCVFNAPAEGVSFGIGYRRRCQTKLEWWGYQMVEKVLGQVYPFWYNTGVWRTPSQPRRRSKYALCITASRSKNRTLHGSCNNALKIQTLIIALLHYHVKGKQAQFCEKLHYCTYFLLTEKVLLW